MKIKPSVAMVRETSMSFQGRCVLLEENPYVSCRRNAASVRELFDIFSADLETIELDDAYEIVRKAKGAKS